MPTYQVYSRSPFFETTQDPRQLFRPVGRIEASTAEEALVSAREAEIPCPSVGLVTPPAVG